MQLVDEVMTKGVEVISESAKLTAAAQKMRDKNIGFLVVGNGSGLTGCVTDRDLVVGGMARGLNPRENRVEEVMTRHLLTCDRSAKVSTAIKLMKENKVYRLVVTDGDVGPVGVVTLGDLAARANDEVDLDEAMRQNPRH